MKVPLVDLIPILPYTPLCVFAQNRYIISMNAEWNRYTKNNNSGTLQTSILRLKTVVAFDLVPFVDCRIFAS